MKTMNIVSFRQNDSEVMDTAMVSHELVETAKLKTNSELEVENLSSDTLESYEEKI